MLREDVKKKLRNRGFQNIRATKHGDVVEFSVKANKRAPKGFEGRVHVGYTNLDTGRTRHAPTLYKYAETGEIVKKKKKPSRGPGPGLFGGFRF